MSQVTEPALTDYARFYGLTFDHHESKYSRVSIYRSYAIPVKTHAV